MSTVDPTNSELAADQGGSSNFDEVSALSVNEQSVAEPTLGDEGLSNFESGSSPEDIATAPPEQLPGFPIIKRAVSGSYRGSVGAFQLDLRVDIDRSRPTNRISGDFFQTVGKTTSYFGSFVVDVVNVTTTPSQVIAKGLGRFTFTAGAPVVQVTIDRRMLMQPQAPATLQFYTTSGTPGARYVCGFVTPGFRSVLIETDRVSNVSTPVFSTYNTGSFPSGGAARNLSVIGAYAEAGVSMTATAGSDVINIAEAGANATWSNAELHASMQQHFSKWQDVPQWAVWQVAAQLHDLGTGLYGIMFDQQGKQRQGCAVFHAGIGGITADKLRLQLYTYVHELGHCFNLLHSWQKSLATPPRPNRPAALSWMNYPWNFPNGGAAAFWGQFPFQFDIEELVHIRHGFRNDVIMGGSNFGSGAGLGRDVLSDPIHDDSGLALEISPHRDGYELGEPVVIELKLRTTDQRGKRVHTWLHPNYGLVSIVISKPSGEVVTYEPMIDHLVGERTARIELGDVIQDSAYIGYGKGGLYFDQAGIYRLRAVYAALDGSQVVSNLMRTRVRYPTSAKDDQVADLLMGEEQGALFYLLGSDADSLRQGDGAFDEVLEKHGTHPLADYVRLAKGVNAARTFKTITSGQDSAVTVRRARQDEGISLLSTVSDSRMIDPVSKHMVLSKLAAAQENAGDASAGSKTMARLATLQVRTR